MSSAELPVVSSVDYRTKSAGTSAPKLSLSSIVTTSPSDPNPWDLEVELDKISIAYPGTSLGA